MTSSDIRDILDETDLFDHCGDGVVSAAVSSSEQVTYEPMDLIYEEGDDSADVFVVSDGSVRVDRSVDDENDAAFIARRSDVIGLLTAMTGEKRRTNATIISDEEAHFVRIALDELIDRLEEDGSQLRSFYDGVMDRMSARLSRSSNIIDTFL